MGNRFTPKGTKYNEEDPLGILAQEAEIQKKIDFPNPIQRFIESEALKKDKARMFRINRPSRYELELDFEDILKKLNRIFSKNRDKYESKSHIIRCAIVKLYKEEFKT